MIYPMLSSVIYDLSHAELSDMIYLMLNSVIYDLSHVEFSEGILVKFVVSMSNGPTVLFRISRVYELSNLSFTVDRISLQVF
jgi:hypothetical protein